MFVRPKNKDMTAAETQSISVICSVIEKLEEKQANETITFEESATLFRLIEQVEYLLSL